MAFEPKLIELFVVEEAELRRQPAERTDQLQLHGDVVNRVMGSRFHRELEAILGFALYFSKRISRHKKIGIKIVAAISCIRKIAALIRSVETALHQFSAGSDVHRPRHDHICKVHIGPRSETLQSASFDEFVSKPPELKSGFVVAKARAGNHPEHDIGNARTVAIPVLEAKIYCLAGGQ